MLAAHGITSSLSRVGDCWDAAVVESFFATRKTELVVDADWPTRPIVQRDLLEFIEVWYNRQRRHQTLGYRTPLQYEREVLKAS